MWITKKRLEEERKKAVEDALEQQWQRERYDNLERRMMELSDRLNKLERRVDHPIPVNAESATLQSI